MARLPLRADEVAGDERLPVTGRERVHGSPRTPRSAGRAGSRRARGRLAGSATRTHCSRARGRRSRRSPAPDAPADPGAIASRTRCERRAVSAGGSSGRRAARRERLVAGAELVDDDGAVARGDDDLAPADPAREGSVREREPAARRRRPEDGIEAHRLRGPLPPGARDVRCDDDGERDTLAVDRQLQLAERALAAYPGRRTAAPSWNVGISARSSA